MKLSEVFVPADFADRFGRKDAWHGDTHKADGTLLDDAAGKVRIDRCEWYPAATGPDDEVEELRIIYTDGEVVKVPAEKLRYVP